MYSRRDVAVLALDDADAGLLGHPAGLRGAEVDQLHEAGVGDDDVGRRHVAVDDAERLALLVGAVVRVIERLADLRDQVERDRLRHRPTVARQ